MSTPAASPWQPIATAPKDGTVILTDEGTARFMRPSAYEARQGATGWYLTGIGHQFPPSCADDGYSIAAISPRYWMPLPDLPNP